MTKDESLKLALEALEEPLSPTKRMKAITAIKEVLAQPEQDEKFCDANCVWTDHHPDCKLAQPEEQRSCDKQEPVAWMCKRNDGHFDVLTDKTCKKCFPVYTSPPQEQRSCDRRTWIGLTDEDKQTAFDETQEGGGFWEFADAIEAKLKEKNT